MSKLLFLNNIFEKSIYTVASGQSLLDVALFNGVPTHFLIRDNKLTAEPECGDKLVVIKRGEMKIMDVETLKSLSTAEKDVILKRNGVDFLFVGMTYI